MSRQTLVLLTITHDDDFDADFIGGQIAFDASHRRDELRAEGLRTGDDIEFVAAVDVAADLNVDLPRAFFVACSAQGKGA